MEEYAIRCARWLENRVRQAEANDPKLRPLKDRINELSIEIKAAQEDAVPALLRQQDEVIQELIDHVSKKSAR